MGQASAYFPVDQKPPVIQASIQMVDELDDTVRGAGGLGSTGR